MEKVFRVLTYVIVYCVIVTGIIIESGYAERWEKVKNDGFGDVDNKSAFPMEIFKDDLYVGTWNDAGTEIWMTPGGTNSDWNQMNINGFGVPENANSTSMEVFSDELYVGVYNEGGGELWLTADGTSWGQVSITDFSSHNNCIRAMSSFNPYESNQQLYIGTDNEKGAEVWMTGNGIDWVLLEDNGIGDMNNTSVRCMAIFNNYLYLGTDNQQSGTQVFRTKGGIRFTQANTDGFGYDSNQTAYSMCNFKGYLYIGTFNHLTGTQVWRTSDGSTWIQSNKDGFENPRNDCSYCMAVFGNYLYVGTGNTVAQVWRTGDGVIWKQVNSDGFGNDDNRRVHSLVVLGDYLYAGSGNKWGTEIWRCNYPEEEIADCFLERVLGDEPHTLDALRVMRDTVLGRDLKGDKYIELYYLYSSEMFEIYSAYPEIREKTNEVLKNLLPRILLISRGEKRRLGSSMNGAVVSLLEAYVKVASPGLRLAARKIKEELRNDSLSNLLHFSKIK